jgi:hypothetical protein
VHKQRAAEDRCGLAGLFHDLDETHPRAETQYSFAVRSVWNLLGVGGQKLTQN